MAPMAFNARPSTGAIVRHHEKARAWAATTKRIEIRMPLDGRGPNGIRAHISGRRIGGQRWRYRYDLRTSRTISKQARSRRAPYTAGSPNDVVARHSVLHLSIRLGQSVIVNSRLG